MGLRVNIYRALQHRGSKLGPGVLSFNHFAGKESLFIVNLNEDELVRHQDLQDAAMLVNASQYGPKVLVPAQRGSNGWEELTYPTYNRTGSGGSFAFSRNSLFRFYYPIAIYDRFETPELR